MKIERSSLASAMNAKVIGSGEQPIILAHGFGSDSSFWETLLHRLSSHRRFKVLVFDWCFSGKVSDRNLFDPAVHESFEGFADDLMVLVDEVGFGGSVFVGHSMSGMIGCIASVKRPDLFTKLVLVAASPRYINSDDYDGGFEGTTIDDMIAGMESDFPKLASMFAGLATSPNPDPILKEKYLRSIKSMVPSVAISLAKTIFYKDNREILNRVTVPCTIVQPSQDSVVPVSVAHYMKRMIRGESTVEIVDVLGHFPQLTAPDQLLSLIG